MVTLVKETGDVVENANSYVDVAESDDFADEILLTPSEWKDLDTADKEIRLIRATRLIDTLVKWNSDIEDTDQELAWPRKEFDDNTGRTIKNDVVPDAVKEATFMLAYQESQSGSLFETQDVVKSERYGRTQVEYATTTQSREYGDSGLFLRRLRVLGYASGEANIGVRRS